MRRDVGSANEIFPVAYLARGKGGVWEGFSVLEEEFGSCGEWRRGGGGGG